ncbi:hypothetical protein PHYSODRAFT_500916 [Phytophthora sojae]|uniref:DUF659 domain-containing protein n=1 Tax=Phytophthora sojae (strain P6497) TaxID=1094619 RepID=G4ZJ34_PHYSP|nr:hypothetical protein PHYSODRAFT_500916 [Phytophthora sojae]EGZ17281.1 hypothetical protein PHYSODRAFT_500916 [Phytophthora sojae]|eukprot:XP_009526339.1 hypothetical protein PHYSODRAFT_500916 [Phytophthora sojae]
MVLALQASKVPSPTDVGDPLLKQTAKEHFEKKVAILMKQKFFAFQLDGWSNPRREKLINLLASGPNMDPLHLETIATGVDSQTG